MLKTILDSLEGLDEPVKELYKEKEGKFYLDIEDDLVLKNKVEEFRANNIKLANELKDIQKKFKGVDLIKYNEAAKKLQELEDRKLIDEGKLDELVDQRVERIKIESANQIDVLSKALDEEKINASKTKEHLSTVLIDSELTRAATSVGLVKQGAMQDIISRGRKVWSLIDGVPTPMVNEKIKYGSDAKTPMTFEEWMQELMTTASHLWEPGTGTGSRGSSTGAGRAKIDWSKISPSARLKKLNDIKKGK